MPDKGYQEALKRIDEAAKENSTELDLAGLGLTTLPLELFSLSNLQNLDLNDNQITEIPEALGNLTNLTELSLYYNQITEIPEALGNLSNLQNLYLSNNQITDIPEALGNLTNLTELSLYYNQITEIPEALGKLSKLERIFLHHNSGLRLPAEVLGPDERDVFARVATPTNPAEILEYCFRVQATGRPLNEAKLILVGRGAVGKSTLVEKLIHGTFTPGTAKTEGINIEKWEIPIEDENVRLNVWDFGGQEIMHATHQFFLTERSLYLLVLNGREGGEDAEAEYWLKLIESFGGESPVIIVLNKVREHPFDLNRTGLLQKYPNIKGFVRTDCGDNTGIDELKEIIFSETATLDELHVKFPGEWFAIKDYLASTDENYLSFDQYRKLCTRNGVGERKYQEMLARFLNQLGIVLNYKDDRRLKDTHVLNPHWVTEGIYKILNSGVLEENHGEIHLDDVSEVLPEKDYPAHMCLFIFELMKKFELCFSFTDDDSHYLIPELLAKDEPQKAAAFTPAECLNFQFQYPVLPEGLLPRFITRTHHLSEGEPRWRSGVILKFEGCRALVKADAEDKKVSILVSGHNKESRRRLLAVIRADLERIHRDIKNLNPTEIVPLPGQSDEVVTRKELSVLERNGVTEFPKAIGEEVRNYNVGELLSSVDLPLLNKEEDKPLKLFYSYAHKDEEHKMELKTHLQILHRQNVIQSWDDRQIESGDEWKTQILGQLESADIILLLISADFIASNFCYEIEMKHALERHRKGEARVIPVIVRDCVWQTADFANLQGVPKDGKAVDTWENKDSAWRDVTEKIQSVAKTLRAKKV